MGRALAICGWLAHQVGRPFRATPLRRYRALPAAVVGVLLLVAATIPFVLPLLDPQPEDVSVADIFDGIVTAPGAWLRIDGRAYPLRERVSDSNAEHALLVDQVNPLRAIVARADEPFEVTDPERVTVRSVTGRLAAESVVVDEDLPIQATVAGTPPRVVPDRVLVLDPVTTAPRSVWWPLSILPALLGALLLVGARAGYPIFRPTKVVDVLAAPLGPGERLPAAYAGRVGPNRRDLADPGGALLLVRRGPKGNLLTAQPLPDDGGVAPAPITIGGGWTAGRIGDVHTVTETVPALQVRSELVDATFLFARTAERDRIASLVALDR